MTHYEELLQIGHSLTASQRKDLLSRIESERAKGHPRFTFVSLSLPEWLLAKIRDVNLRHGRAGRGSPLISDVLKIARCKNPPRCRGCGCTGEEMFGGTGYHTYCSHMCLNTSEAAWEQRKATTKAKFGTENVFASKQFKAKIGDIIEAKYGVGVRNPRQSKEVNQKVRDTFRRNWGEDHFMKTDAGAKHHRRKVREKLGVDNVMELKSSVEAIRRASREKYGTEWASQSKTVKKKTLRTNRSRYGEDNPAKSPQVKERISSSLRTMWQDPKRAKRVKAKIEKTFRRHYGEKHPSHNADWWSKRQQSMLTTKRMNLGGETILYQGFEDKVLRRLHEKGYRVATSRKLSFLYKSPEGKERRYYPDILAVNPRSGQKHVLEVKSTWTLLHNHYGKSYISNLAKFSTARKECKKRNWKFWLALVVNSKIIFVENPTHAKINKILARYSLS